LCEGELVNHDFKRLLCSLVWIFLLGSGEGHRSPVCEVLAVVDSCVEVPVEGSVQRLPSMAWPNVVYIEHVRASF
jgi:hypothetical protein